MTLDDRDGDVLSSCEGDCDDLDGLMNQEDADRDNSQLVKEIAMTMILHHRAAEDEDLVARR